MFFLKFPVQWKSSSKNDKPLNTEGEGVENIK